MAQQRIIKTKCWDDKYVRSLDPHGKLLFIYLFTNSLATLSGAYEIELDRITFDTRIPPVKRDLLLTKFAVDGKAFYKDGWLVMVNTIKHQASVNPKIKKGIEESVKCCPDWIKDRLSIAYDWLSHLNLNLNLNSNLNPIRREATAEPPPAAPTDPRKSHPAIVAIEDVTRRYPPQEIWDDIIDQLGLEVDVGKLRKAFAAWVSHGYNKTNYDWAFDWYLNGIPKYKEKHNGSNRTKQTPAEIIAGRTYRK